MSGDGASPDTPRAVLARLIDLRYGTVNNWAGVILQHLAKAGFFVVRRGQAVDHDGNVYNLEVADEHWIIRCEPPALYRLEPLPEQKP